MRIRTTLLVLAASTIVCGSILADPCGMVPPIYDGPGVPITRIGEQQTYVFFKDGIESVVIRPSFSGNVDEFGMLIPFPTPPALRKVPDHIFPHIAAAIDPPEVVINLSPPPRVTRFSSQLSSSSGIDFYSRRARVRVLRQEAVGMYEVAVLEAGSAAALNRWMDDHGFRYPVGMDKVTEDYIDLGWCFVAVKTQVGQKQGVDAKPGQRSVKKKLPAGSGFDGNVQAMGFRFKTDELVVPMRLSAFNDGKLRNIVYLLTAGPRKIRSIPEEYVVRQINGRDLFNNVTQPLPLRILGGALADLKEQHLRNLKQRRDPTPKNGAAKELFASDLLALSSGKLSLPQEEKEKELLRIGEHFGLRGSEIDKLNSSSLKASKSVQTALKDIRNMTLTVVDGDFPREVIAKKNLTFADYRMPEHRNRTKNYDAKLKGPAPKKQGQVFLGALDKKQIRQLLSQRPGHDTKNSAIGKNLFAGLGKFAIPISAFLVGLALIFRRRRRVVE